MHQSVISASQRTPIVGQHVTVRAQTQEPQRSRAINRKSQFRENVLGLCSKTLGAFTSGLLLWSQPAMAEIQRFPASTNPEIFAVQKTMVEAWDIVNNVFVDRTDERWFQDLSKYIKQAYSATDSNTAYKSISSMLSDLGDPYTRIVPPEEYSNFKMTSDGELNGVGLLIATDPSNGKIMVLAPIRGSPAERAGILPGDEVLSINGRSTRGMDGKGAAQYLRGKSGTTVYVKLARVTDGVPGVPARIEQKPQVKYRSVQMKREAVELNPVFYSNVHEAGMNLGYIKLTSFSNKSPDAVKDAVSQLNNAGADGFVLDLRSNPGGLVQAGIDVAGVWLDGHASVFNITGRDSAKHKNIELPDGHASTEKPLVILVNQNSASASEILAGALHDNKRASIVGERTFGKGKIQNVFELQDGSALFVTVARYQTPNLSEIDEIGIEPDLGCFPNKVSPPPIGEGQGVPGPAVMETKTIIEADLEMDDCFLTAERLLNKKVPHAT
eukprot:g5979.t1